MHKEKNYVKLTNLKFDHPNTSLLVFHFDSSDDQETRHLSKATVQFDSIEGKDIFIIDDFFSDELKENMREVTENYSFSRSSYGSLEGKENGEVPARSMNNQEKWAFFSKPPEAIESFYHFLGFLSAHLNAKISTLPWDLCDDKLCASAFATNRLERCLPGSMVSGKHTDYDPLKGLPFAIPILYEDNAYHPSNFINGAPGKPLLISAMLYVTAKHFDASTYGLGTVFCDTNGHVVKKVDCQHMRLVLFEGDILHSIDESMIPEDVHTWRVSYVFKLMINPKHIGESMKYKLRDALSKG